MNACILVVDDDPEIVGAIAITLEREGYRVLRAYDGMEALDLALDPAVRLILIDVMMPKLDGLSALLRIREKRNLPVIVLSAKSEDTDKILGLSMGADDYVTKPFNPVTLGAKVKALIRRSRNHLPGVDSVIAAQAPKLSPYREAMRENLAAAMGVAVENVGVKATTTEHLGHEGREEGITAYATCLVCRI